MQTTSIIAGIDEAGRGALAGPVVAGAAVLCHPMYKRRRAKPCWSPYKRIPQHDVLIADSKMLEPAERESAYEWITTHCYWGVGIVEAHVIDEIGILRANERAMLLALEQLCTKALPTQLLVDGNDKYHFPIPHASLIKGDSREPCIAAASIIAKVTRDRIMCEQHLHHPLFQFHVHKGYGTQEHRAAIAQYGPCALHRTSFIQNILHAHAASLHTYSN